VPIQLNQNSTNLGLHVLPFENDPANLVSLTCGVHVPQFDEAVWVPVPKFGQYLVHFLRLEPTLAKRYHNVLFEGTAVTSGRLLLARFAWATFHNAQKAHLSGFQFHRPQKDNSAGEKVIEKKVESSAGKKTGGRGYAKEKKRARSPDEYMPSGSREPATDTFGGGYTLRSVDKS